LNLKNLKLNIDSKLWRMVKLVSRAHYFDLLSYTRAQLNYIKKSLNGEHAFYFTFTEYISFNRVSSQYIIFSWHISSLYFWRQVYSYDYFFDNYYVTNSNCTICTYVGLCVRYASLYMIIELWVVFRYWAAGDKNVHRVFIFVMHKI